jgi:hypothetical protein
VSPSRLNYVDLPSYLTGRSAFCESFVQWPNRSGSRGRLACACGHRPRPAAGRMAKLYNGRVGYFCRGWVGNPICASQLSAQAGPHFQPCKLRLRLDGDASRRISTTRPSRSSGPDATPKQLAFPGDPTCRVQRRVERISNQGMASCTMLASSWPMNAPMQTVTTNHG